MHLCERTGRKQPAAAVCGEPRPIPKVSTVADLFASTTPCQRCLEWVVEQGQLASRRLSDLQARKLDDLYLEKVNHKEPT